MGVVVGHCFRLLSLNAKGEMNVKVSALMKVVIDTAVLGHNKAQLNVNEQPVWPVLE